MKTEIVAGRSNPVTIEADFTPDEARALAQFLKRVGFHTCESLSDPTDKDEPYLMQEGLAVVRRALAAKGYSPR